MPTDYGGIRAENIRRYGEDTDVLSLLARLYADRTHFIFELLQNAEDAGAQSVSFHLHPDRLEVRHDGRPFGEDDIRGICGVLKSTKADDLTKIGKFGIGFKSVYAYTRTPEVHSGDEHFAIEHYVRPQAVGSRPADAQPGETIFVLPFDRADTPPAMAVNEIAKALNALPLRTLLFLRNIRSLEVRGTGVTPTRLCKGDPIPAGNLGGVVTMLGNTAGRAEQQESWIVWERSLEGLGQPYQRVEIAGRLVKDERKVLGIERIERSPLVVFFPTEKETSLGFLIQGPYQTTPARDNIPGDNPWNQSLVEETAQLLLAALRDMRDRGWLTVDLLGALPIQPEQFPDGSMFRPIYDAVRDCLRAEPMLPVQGGGYTSANSCKLARSAVVRALLDPESLEGLWPGRGRLHWVSEGVTPDRTPLLHRYAREELGIEEITAESMLRRLTPTFLALLTLSWVP